MWFANSALALGDIFALMDGSGRKLRSEVA